MPWAKGQSGHPGGKRSPQLARARNAIARVVDEQAEKIGDWFEGLAETEGKAAAIKAFVALAEYALPKLARTEISGELGVKQQSDVELDALIAKNAAALGYKIEADDKPSVQ